jgi:exosortase/archaeosortase family protein
MTVTADASGGVEPLQDAFEMSFARAGANGRLGAGKASRAVLFCGLVAVGFANGISEHAGTEFERNGPLLALFNTFGVSAVIWAASIVGIVLLLRSTPRAISGFDIATGVFAAACFLVPAPFVSWLGIAAIGANLRLSRWSDPAARRAGTILLALTIPVLWARVLFASASTAILDMDAKLIGLVTGTASHGNTIDLADGSGVIFLEPGCSSITNLSLVILCGVLFVKGQGHGWSKSALASVIAAGAVTVLINVVRISLIGVMPQYYDSIHGPVGSSLASWATIVAMLAIFTYGIGFRDQNRP